MNGDLTILESIIRAIEAGGHDEFRPYEQEFRQLYSELKQAAASGVKASGSLNDILRKNPTLMTETVYLITEDALAFVRKEVERHSEIKKKRPLSESEKKLGNEYLTPLLSSLAALLDKLGHREPPAGHPEGS